MSENACIALKIQRWLGALRENAPEKHSDYPSAYQAVQLIKHIPDDTITFEDIALIAKWLRTCKSDLDFNPSIDPELLIQSNTSLTEVEKKIFGLYTIATRSIEDWWTSIEPMFMKDAQTQSFFKPLAAALALYPDTPFGDYVQAVTCQTDSGHHAFRSSRLPAPHSTQTYHTSHSEER